MSEATIATAVPTRDELRTVPLSAINVREGFNPRERFDQRELDRLAASIASRGLLQPLIVTPGEQAGNYELVAGERRYRACFAIGLTEVPVLIRASLSSDGEESLVDAIVENLHRSDHTPLEEATAFARLLDTGLTRKGICDQLSVTPQRVRDRLELLKVPGELHGPIDAGEIPLAAVPALVELAAIHPGLPACAYRRVTHQPQQSWQPSLEWADVVADPIGAVTCRYATDIPDLPDGVYDAGVSYPLATFSLPEKAQRDLERLAELDPVWAGEGPELMITWEMVDHARTLGAAHVSPHGRSALVVGTDVVSELAASVITRHLREERVRVRHERDHHTATLAAAAASNGAPVSEEDLERTQEQARQAEREAQRQARLDAEAYNDRLGAAIVKTLSTVKLDERAIKILTAVDLHGELDGIAMRGARYGFPDWVTLETTKSGKTKRAYLERPAALAKARDYLKGAQRPGEIAGRCLALIAMAVLADEDCVARSNRSGHDLYRYRTSHYSDIGSPSGLEWARSVVGLVEEICLEQLPAAATERLRDRREQEQEDRAQADAEDRAAQAAYTQLARQLDTLSADEREAAIVRFEHDHPAGDFLAEQLQTRHEELTVLAESPADIDASDSFVEQAA